MAKKKKLFIQEGYIELEAFPFLCQREGGITKMCAIKGGGGRMTVALPCALQFSIRTDCLV